MFLLRAHLTEGAVVSVGQEAGIVAEAERPARRKDEIAVDAALESFDMTIGPGDRQRADEPSAPRPRRAARLQAPLRYAPSPGRNPCRRRRPSARNRCRARRRDRRRRCRNRPRAPAARSADVAARALMSALAMKLSPVSSGSGRPNSPAETSEIPCGSKQVVQLGELALVVCRRDDAAFQLAGAHSELMGRRPCNALRPVSRSCAPGR